MEEKVKEIAHHLKAFLSYNKIIRDKYHVMLLYSMPYDEPSQGLAEEECVKQMMPDVKLIPLEDSDEAIKFIPDKEDVSDLKAYIETMKTMLSWCKEDKKYCEAMTRAGLLCLLYEQIRALISIHYGHVIPPLLALENRLYAPMPVDRQAFAKKIIDTMEFYKNPKVPWSDEKKLIYTLLDFFTEEAGGWNCNDFDTLKVKVLSTPLTDDSPIVLNASKREGQNFTADVYKDLFCRDEFVRAKELNRFYNLLDDLADGWKRVEIAKALSQEEKLFTMPVTWVTQFMNQMEEEFFPKKDTV